MEVTTRTNPPFPGNAAGSDGAINKASAGLHGAVDRLAVAADDTVRNIKPAIDRVANMAHQAVNKVADAAGPTADWVRQQAAVSRSCVQAHARPMHINARMAQSTANTRTVATARLVGVARDMPQALAEPRTEGKGRRQDRIRSWPLRSMAAVSRVMASRSWLRNSLAVARTGAETPQNSIRARIEPR